MSTRSLGLVAVVGVCLSLAAIVAADDHGLRYPIMQPDRPTLDRWVGDYLAAPRLDLPDGAPMPQRGSLNLLDHLQYTPAQHNQGNCGNCWAWAGTGVLGIALDFAGVHDRLSVQYLDSCWLSDWACCGGWLSDFASFYTFDVTAAIPWSNTNAQWQDGNRTCADGSSQVVCGSIATSPDYPITSVNDLSITTTGVAQTTAIANIKNVLDQNQAVWLAFYLADAADWGVFFDFWSYQPETAIWDPDYSCGHTFIDGEGGGHAVLVVGYDDNDPDPANHYWLVLNSWGTAGGGRPNGLFRMAMDIDYSCTYQWGSWTYDSLLWQTLDVSFQVGEPPLFADGFETGDWSRWSDVMP